MVQPVPPAVNRFYTGLYWRCYPGRGEGKLKDEGYWAVVDEAHLHAGGKLALPDRKARRLKPPDEKLEEPAGLLRFLRGIEARPCPLRKIGSQRELGNHEELSSHGLHGEVHLALIVLKDPKLCHLPGEIRGRGLGISLLHPDEHEEPLADPGDLPAFHGDPGFPDPLHNDLQESAFPAFAGGAECISA